MSHTIMQPAIPVMPIEPVKAAPVARRKRLSPARIGVYAFLFSAALYFLLPLYVMIITSFKSMDEIRNGNVFALPMLATVEPWRNAWSQVSGGFWNSVAITVPSTIIPILLGAINGYALSFWKPRGATCCSGCCWPAPSSRCR